MGLTTFCYSKLELVAVAIVSQFRVTLSALREECKNSASQSCGGEENVEQTNGSLEARPIAAGFRPLVHVRNRAGKRRSTTEAECHVFDTFLAEI